MKHGPHLFEYAVVRVVPRVEREEFINVGVVLLCRPQNFLAMQVHLDEARLSLYPALDRAVLDAHIRSFQQVCEGGPGSGPIGQLTTAERFRWLTASRSTLLQTSPVHPGLCDNAADMIQHLMAQLVA